VPRSLIGRSREILQREVVNYTDIITTEPKKHRGKPCVRGLRITVYEVLEMLAAGMTHAGIIKEFTSSV
jgi:uncharacterized protein (DUF433 family)